MQLGSCHRSIRGRTGSINFYRTRGVADGSVDAPRRRSEIHRIALAAGNNHAITLCFRVLQISMFNPGAFRSRTSRSLFGSHLTYCSSPSRVSLAPTRTLATSSTLSRCEGGGMSCLVTRSSFRQATISPGARCLSSPRRNEDILLSSTPSLIRLSIPGKQLVQGCADTPLNVERRLADPRSNSMLPMSPSRPPTTTEHRHLRYLVIMCGMPTTYLATGYNCGPLLTSNAIWFRIDRLISWATCQRAMRGSGGGEPTAPETKYTGPQCERPSGV